MSNSKKEKSCSTCYYRNTPSCNPQAHVSICYNQILTDEKSCTNCKYFFEFSDICDGCKDGDFKDFVPWEDDENKKDNKFQELCNKIKNKYKDKKDAK